MTKMLETHSSVMQIRFDLRYPDNSYIIHRMKYIYDFNSNLKRSLNREKVSGGHRVDPHLIWVQEQINSPHPHFHYLLLVNGNAKRNYYSILKKVEKIWNLAIDSDLQGLVNYCDRDKQGNKQENGIIVQRNSPSFSENLDKCFYQASYLAKENGKQNRTKGSWLCGGTRIS